MATAVKKQISADVQVSDHAENLHYAASGSVQFPSLIGLPTQCLLPIIAEQGQTATLAQWKTTAEQTCTAHSERVLITHLEGFLWLLSVVEKYRRI